MKRVFSVQLESVRVVSINGRTPSTVEAAYEVVADTAIDAIRRATRQARRDHAYRGAYVVIDLTHRGPAV
jgi:hypothetical protein